MTTNRVITKPEMLRQAQNWLCNHQRHPNVPTVTGIYSKVEMVEVTGNTSGPYRSVIPGQVHWYLETKNSYGDIHTYEIPEYEVKKMMDLITHSGTVACMWCGQEVGESIIEAHEEVCGA